MQSPLFLSIIRVDSDPLNWDYVMKNQTPMPKYSPSSTSSSLSCWATGRKETPSLTSSTPPSPNQSFGTSPTPHQCSPSPNYLATPEELDCVMLVPDCLPKPFKPFVFITCRGLPYEITMKDDLTEFVHVNNVRRDKNNTVKGTRVHKRHKYLHVQNTNPDDVMARIKFELFDVDKNTLQVTRVVNDNLPWIFRYNKSHHQLRLTIDDIQPITGVPDDNPHYQLIVRDNVTDDILQQNYLSVVWWKNVK